LTTTNKDFIIFIGGVFNDDYLSRVHAISPAANRWQKGFIEGLLLNNIDVELISNIPERFWPFGNFYVKSNNSSFFLKNTSEINYLNLPYIKFFFISIKLILKFFKLYKKSKKPLCVITYNGAVDNTFASYFIQKFFKLKWIDLCADHYDPKKNWSNYNFLAKKAWGHIFLSNYAYKNGPFDKKYHLEGGFDIKSFIKPSKNKNFTILYSGMMSKWGGVDLLLEGFKNIILKDIELWICGHGTNENLLDDLKNDNRIKYFGFVSDDKLHELSLKADIFVNPRPSNINGNKMNFPSKILEYLSYKKPIVSTWTPGLSDEYKDVLIIVDNENPENISKKILEVYNWKDSDYKHFNKRVLNFSLKKSWRHQTKFFIKWLKENI
tara:strand:+ start:23594 stop:24733 length:1140 start_codon:yes stop_codon:yes gene_type:complete